MNSDNKATAYIIFVTAIPIQLGYSRLLHCLIPFDASTAITSMLNYNTILSINSIEEQRRYWKGLE